MIFKNVGNLSECLLLHSPVLFPKLSKYFPNIKQRRHEPLLPVTDRPLVFSCTVYTRVQVERVYKSNPIFEAKNTAFLEKV